MIIITYSIRRFKLFSYIFQQEKPILSSNEWKLLSIVIITYFEHISFHQNTLYRYKICFHQKINLIFQNNNHRNFFNNFLSMDNQCSN